MLIVYSMDWLKGHGPDDDKNKLTLYQVYENRFENWTGPNWKHLADEKINMIEKLKFVLGRIENIVEKRRKDLFFKVVKSQDCVVKTFNSLPHNKILDWSKLKAFADDKLNATEKLKFVLGRVENIVGKGENAGYQHFLLFPQCFQKPSLSGSLKVGIVW